MYLASRSKQRAEDAIADLKKQTGKEAIFLELDLANLKGIKKSAETFLRCEFLLRTVVLVDIDCGTVVLVRRKSYTSYSITGLCVQIIGFFYV